MVGIWRLVALAAVVATTVTMAACRHHHEHGSNERPNIVVSIHPVASLVNHLVDGWADVQTLLPPGGNPHGFELTPRQLQMLSTADILVVVGMDLDPWAEKAARDAGRSDLRIIRFSDLVGITDGEDEHAAHDDHDHDHDHHGHDHAHPAANPNAADAATLPTLTDAGHQHHDHSGPNAHLWLDPILVDRFIAQLAIRVEPTLPRNLRQSLRMRANMARHEVFRVDVDFRAATERLRSRKLVTFHNAFDLLAERYELEVVAHLTEIELAPGGEVTPRQLRETIDAVTRYNLKVIYAEPQFPDTAMQAIRQQTGVQILRLDPQGHPEVEGYRTWFEMMRSNMATLVQGQNL
jgi:zinc transport system substrate-binding protein